MIIGYDSKRLFHNNTGLGHYSRTLLESLYSRYPEIVYLLFNPQKKTIDFRVRDGMKEILPKSVLWKNFSSLWRINPILKQINQSKLDIYHGLSGELPYGIGKLNLKKIVTVHDLIFIRYPKLYQPLDRWIYTQKIKYAVRTADVIIAISEQTKRDIIQYFNVKEHKIEVIYQSCNDLYKTPYPLSEREIVLRKYHIPKNYILCVGTIEERKNALTIVKAIKNIDTTLVLVGNFTSYVNRIKSYIKEEKIEHKVVFLNGLGLNELACIYQSARLFVYPSIFEGFGIPIIEALYSKIPVIAAKGSCLEEAGGPHSIYINPFNFESLSRHIVELLNNESKRQTQIEKSFDFVSGFENEKIATQYLEVYKNIINNRYS